MWLFELKGKFLDSVINGNKTTELMIIDSPLSEPKMYDDLTFKGIKSKFNITRVISYTSLEIALISEGIRNILPEGMTLKEGVEFYESEFESYKKKYDLSNECLIIAIRFIPHPHSSKEIQLIKEIDRIIKDHESFLHMKWSPGCPCEEIRQYIYSFCDKVDIPLNLS